MVDPKVEHRAGSEAWPALPLAEWAQTYATLHMWTQIIGKICLARAPMINHWWHITFHVTARGMTTSPLPDGDRTFQIDFDFLDHRLTIATSTGDRVAIPLVSRTVADFYEEVMSGLRSLGMQVRIWTRPVEVENPIPFDRDREHATYDPEHARRLFAVLVQADRVMRAFRSRFVGKCSPVHFFWGAFDMAVTRFSGRRGPVHPGGLPNVGDWVTREGYSHECASCGFWPGGGPIQEAVFYAYAYPEPSGYRDWPIKPAEARYDDTMREFLLPYEAVRTSQYPDRVLLDFFQSTYEAVAERGGWDREALEKSYPAPGERIL